MRISDWSSDVCSSDLFDLDRQLPTQVQVGVEHEIPNLAKRRARAGIEVSDIRLAEARLGVVGRDVEDDAGRAWTALAYGQKRLALVSAPDRPRGVKGKSVSVRVDIGGRRSLKKENVH